MTQTAGANRSHRRSTLEAARKMMFAEAAEATTASGRLMVRQLDRICAMTGIPWERINEEAKKEGL